MTITSRDVINEANRRYRAGLIGDDEYIRVVNPYASNQARFLLGLLKRERGAKADSVIDADYRMVAPTRGPRKSKEGREG